MRMTPERKEAARQAILNAAARQFRLAGQAGMGVDAIAREVGQTSGAFYAHFGSKAEVFLGVIAGGLRRLMAGVEQAGCSGRRGWAVEFAAHYLSRAHRDRVADGCLLPALSPDVARAGAAARALFANDLTAVAAALAPGCDAPDPEAALDRAYAVLALCAGGVMLSRALPDGPEAERVLAACRAATACVAGRPAA
jgi:AcrR family transcriptional regulator